MRVRAVILRVLAVALVSAFGAMQLVSVRYDETWGVAWNGPSPPQYGWPLPWTAWNGVSSLYWIVSPLPLVIDLLVYAVPLAPLAGLAEWLVKRRPGTAAKVFRGALGVGAVAMLVLGLSAVLPFFAGWNSFDALESFREPAARVWFGRFEALP